MVQGGPPRRDNRLVGRPLRQPLLHHFDATGALIEQKDADGNVTVVTTASSGSSATPIPSLWWFIAGGGVLVVLAGGAVFLRRRKG